MTTPTLPATAVVGRRIKFTYYRDLNTADGTEHPGIITGIVPTQGASLKIRLDGRRSSLHVPPAYEGLRYLDEVVPVPALPMGRFMPSLDTEGFNYAYGGVLVVGFDDDGLAALTPDRDKAVAAVSTYLREVHGMDDEGSVRDEVRWLESKRAFFEWEPEDAEHSWSMHFAEDGDVDQVIRLHYLAA